MPRRRPKPATLVVGVVVGAILLTAIAGGGVLFVFGSAVSLIIALSLAGASSIAGMAFAETADRARLIGDAAVLVSLFWLGLAFIALYHVLWVVYILILTSTWPLRVVVPK